MFRFITLPLLVKIFFMLNDHNLVAARSIELVKQDEIENGAGSLVYPIRNVSESDVRAICDEYFCKSKNFTEIAEDVGVSNVIVEYVIGNNCSNNCTIYEQNGTAENVVGNSSSNNYTINSQNVTNECVFGNNSSNNYTINAQNVTTEYAVGNNSSSNYSTYYQHVQKSICADSKCKNVSTSEIAADLGVSESAVMEVIADCYDLLLPCEVDKKTKERVFFLACLQNLSAEEIKAYHFVDLPLETIQSIIHEAGCSVIQ